jgi:huntingtin-interacting protein 1-related protein
LKSNKDELEKVKRDLRFAQEKAEDLERTKASEISSMLAKYNREMADLEEALHVPNLFSFTDTIQAKTRALDDNSRRLRDRDGELEELLRQKEEELEIYKTGMDSTLLQLKELQLVATLTLSSYKVDPY